MRTCTLSVLAFVLVLLVLRAIVIVCVVILRARRIACSLVRSFVRACMLVPCEIESAHVRECA